MSSPSSATDEAGPSNTRRSPCANGSSSQNGQGGGNGAPRPSASYRRKPRQSLDEVFERQDVKEVQRIGAGLRDLQAEAEDNRTHLASLTAKTLLTQLQKQDALFHDLKDTSNGAMDARLFASQTESSVRMAKRFKLETNSFDIDEFLIRVKARLGLDGRHRAAAAANRHGDVDEDGIDELEESMSDDGRPRRGRRRGDHAGGLGDWESIGWMAAKMYRRVPGMEFMYGPLTTEHKKRTQTQRARRVPPAPEQRPQEITERAEGPVDDTPTHVMSVGKKLDEQDPDGQGINFFKFVINPSDFGQSVENMFFVSFLIRDGKAGIKVSEEDGEILICSRDPSDDDEGGPAQRYQGVMEFDHEMFDMAIKTFNITMPPAIPNRPKRPREELRDDRWYS